MYNHVGIIIIILLLLFLVIINPAANSNPSPLTIIASTSAAPQSGPGYILPSHHSAPPPLADGRTTYVRSSSGLFITPRTFAAPAPTITITSRFPAPSSGTPDISPPSTFAFPASSSGTPDISPPSTFAFPASSSGTPDSSLPPTFAFPAPSPPVRNTGLVIGLVVGGCVLVGGTGLVLLGIWKRRGRRGHEGDVEFEIPEFEAGMGPKKFSYTELARATKKFAENEKLGEGGFGGVYKGYLTKLNTYVAVKRVSKGSRQGVKEFASEVKIITRLRHRNLVQLIGWCHERSELLLVYEFMPNGSLDYHLFKGKTFLTWEIRYKIAQGIASALLYLHQEWEQCVLHRDIKSSNVMLDSSFNAKLGDFGLARLVDHEKGSQTTILAGTMGYMAPESVISGKASKETDVYSFGVVALELACGRKPINLLAKEEGEVNLVEWVWSLYGAGRLFEAADSKLSYNQHELKNLMMVGLWCAHPDYNSRPSISQASRVLNFEAALPNLPLSMPKATYDVPLVNTIDASFSTSDPSNPVFN